MTAPESMRLDKWLWAARFFKTRALAVHAIEMGRVRLGGATVKPAREVKPGDRLSVQATPSDTRTVVVRALSLQRGPAPVAQQLYEETADSLAERAHRAEQRRLAPEPAHSLVQGRPTKRDRRALDAARRTSPPPGWGDRWSAALDDD